MIDPIVLLKKDHREAADLLKKLAASKPGARRNATVKKLDGALKLHMKIEEQLVYPLVSKLVGNEEAKEAGIEHGLVREGLVNLTKLDDEPGFGAAGRDAHGRHQAPRQRRGTRSVPGAQDEA